MWYWYHCSTLQQIYINSQRTLKSNAGYKVMKRLISAYSETPTEGGRMVDLNAKLSKILNGEYLTFRLFIRDQ